MNVIEMHPAKRRKLDQPQSSLNKPFRSPLHAATKSQAPTPLSNEEAADPRKDPATEVPTSLTSNNAASGNRLQSSRTSPGSVGQPRSTYEDPEDLRKQHISLSIQLTQIRRSLETAEHALQLEASAQGPELERLITKWRIVAQEAADELFVDAKDRIDGMGGVAAWRKRAGEDSQRWNDNDQEQSYQTHKMEGEDDDVRSQDEFRTTDRRELSEPEEDEESSFSMEMMLRSMNIDLQAIGFDKQLDRWVE